MGRWSTCSPPSTPGTRAGAAPCTPTRPSTCPARVEALALAAGLGREAAHSQLASAVDVVLHLGRDPDGTRRLRQVALPVRERSGLVTMAVALELRRDGGTALGPAADRLAERLAG